MTSIEIIRGAGLKPTMQRVAILDTLLEQDGPLLAKELHALVQQHGIDLATVHRTLHRFVAVGIVDTSDADRSGVRYVRHGLRDHHHVLECRRCHDTVTLPTCTMASVDRAVARASAWQGVTHAVRFYGICPQCR